LHGFKAIKNKKEPKSVQGYLENQNKADQKTDIGMGYGYSQGGSAR